MISILILTYNRLEVVKKFFESIKVVLKREDVFEMLVLDNGSTDGTAEFVGELSRLSPKIKTFRLKENLGCAGGRNFLLSFAMGNIILILDSDVIINSPAFIDKLLLSVEKPGVGIAGMHGMNLNQETMSFEELPKYFEGKADYVSGFCQMFKRDMLEKGCKIDTFYNPYFAEDVDFCYQVKEKTGLYAYKLREDGDISHNWGQTNLGTNSENKIKFEYLFKKFNLNPKEGKKIPKIVHQTWKTDDIPYSIYNKRWVESWKKLNPEWEYKLWTDKKNREFIKENYPWFLKIYDSYPENIQRADAVRYFILYHFGGLYVDLDFECLKNIDPLLENKTLVFGRVYPTKETFNEIPNAFMASTKKNKFWVRIFIELIKHKDCAEVEYSTGPVMLTNTITENCIEKKKYEVEIIPPELVYPVSWEKEALCLNNLPQETLDTPELAYPEAYAITYWAHNWGDKFIKKNENNPERYSNEIEHWKRWLVKKDDDDRNFRLNPKKEFAFFELLPEFSEKEINVLDVGSGPITSIGYCYKDYKINIFPTDILAKEYAKIMEEEKITAPIPTLAVAGEFLDNYFPKLFFHISIAGNSLDHSENPILILEKMEKLTKPGGFIVLGHYYNEGEYENYSGIHEWNFYINKDKPFLCNKDKSKNYDLNKIFLDRLDMVKLDCTNRNPKERGFIKIIYKKKNTKKTNNEVAVIFLGTGEYLNFFPKYYQTIKQLFLPETKKTFFVFTDEIGDPILKNKNDVIPIFIPKENWPLSTLFRFKYIESISEKLKNFSHVVYMDADTHVHSLISENEFFCHDKPLFGVQHPGFVKTLGTFEFDKKSLAAVDEKDDLSVYWQGCFWGGKTESVLKLAKELKKRCETDLSKNVIALWHDESHLNKYFVENKQDVHTYHPGFAFTENHILWEIDPVYSRTKYPKKIVHANKRCEMARQKD